MHIACFFLLYPKKLIRNRVGHTYIRLCFLFISRRFFGFDLLALGPLINIFWYKLLIKGPRPEPAHKQSPQKLLEILKIVKKQGLIMYIDIPSTNLLNNFMSLENFLMWELLKFQNVPAIHNTSLYIKGSIFLLKMLFYEKERVAKRWFFYTTTIHNDMF